MACENVPEIRIDKDTMRCQNCGGCGTICSAPSHKNGVPTCRLVKPGDHAEDSRADICESCDGGGTAPYDPSYETCHYCGYIDKQCICDRAG